MAVIQSKINRIFDDDLLAQLDSDLIEKAEEEYSFEAGELGIHAQSEDNYNDAAKKTMHLIATHRHLYDVFDILDLKLSDEGHFVFEDCIIDIPDACESILEKEKARQYLLNNVAEEHQKFITETTVDLAKDLKSWIIMRPEARLDFDKPINSTDQLNRVFVDAVKEANIEMLKNSFNSQSLSKNHLYKHLSQVIDNEFEQEFDQYCNAENPRDRNTTAFKKDPLKFLMKAKYTLATYRENENLFKTKQKEANDSPEYFSIFDHDRFETIDDGLNEIMEAAKTKKYIKRFLGSYKNLLDDEGYQLFERIRESRIDDSIVRFHLSKVALFEDAQTMNNTLINILGHYVDTKDDIKYKIDAKNLDAPVLYEKGDIMAVALNDFEASSSLSPSRWCIGNSAHYFKSYQGVDRTNIAVYDFSKRRDDPNYLIGITVNKNGDLNSSFNSKDVNIKDEISKNPEKINFDEIINGLNLIDSKRMAQAIKHNRVDNLHYQAVECPIHTFSCLDSEELKKATADWEKEAWVNAIEKSATFQQQTQITPLKQVVNETFKALSCCDKAEEVLSSNQLKSFKEAVTKLDSITETMLTKQYPDFFDAMNGIDEYPQNHQKPKKPRI